MSSPESPPLDLIDLKFLPAWLKEHEQSAPRYSDYEAESDERRNIAPVPGRRRTRPHKQHTKSRGLDRRPTGTGAPQATRGPARRDKPPRKLPVRAEPSQVPSLAELEIRFLPRTDAFANVAAQISAAPVAYSVYALAKLFLQKAERYDVRVTTKGSSPLFRIGDTAAIASDRHQLENIAFRLLRDEYYNVNVTLSEPVKGNFSTVARERISGVLLGPTNHHGYQPQLRRLYEQRFSRRMDFREFQRQIEIVTDPALVEAWKEEARKITTFTSLKENSPRTFNSEIEAERDFREKYLPSLISETREVVVDGVSSRNLRDRGIARAIENAWSGEVRSPSNLMQELSGRLRSAGLQVFRHRKGMLFVSPVRPNVIDETAVSDSVRGILDGIKTSPRINRKDLAEKLIDPQLESASAEKAKLTLAADIRWLIREGHIIEFNDGTLDLPRPKSVPVAEKERSDQTATPGPEALEQQTRVAVDPVAESARDDGSKSRSESSEVTPSSQAEPHRLNPAGAVSSSTAAD